MIDSSELRKGIAIELDGQLYTILDFQHIKMGRGSAQVRLRLRAIRTGHTIERTFQAGAQIKCPAFQIQPIRFNLGEIQDIVDDRQQRLAAVADRIGKISLL